MGTKQTDIWNNTSAKVAECRCNHNYVILHFKGTEATFWINGEFNHSTI